MDKNKWKIEYFEKDGRIFLRKQNPIKCPLEEGDRIKVHVNMLTSNIARIIKDLGGEFLVEHEHRGGRALEKFAKYKCELYNL